MWLCRAVWLQLVHNTRTDLVERPLGQHTHPERLSQSKTESSCDQDRAPLRAVALTERRLRWLHRSRGGEAVHHGPFHWQRRCSSWEGLHLAFLLDCQNLRRCKHNGNTGQAVVRARHFRRNGSAWNRACSYGLTTGSPPGSPPAP